MMNPTMTSQWDPGSYKPLDMRKIPGYPRQMPHISKRWFPKFTGGNEEGAEFHMRDFYSYFVLNPVEDYDLNIKPTKLIKVQGLAKLMS